MDEPNGDLGRRGFIKKVTQSAAAIAASSGIASGAIPKDKKIELADTIPVRILGKTGVELPILGYGGAALPKEWGNPLPFEGRVKVVRHAYDCGVRYFDTAGNYFDSQKFSARR